MYDYNHANNSPRTQFFRREQAAQRAAEAGPASLLDGYEARVAALEAEGRRLVAEMNEAYRAQHDAASRAGAAGDAPDAVAHLEAAAALIGLIARVPLR